MSTVDRYAVCGNPITHSKSPQIHQAFAKEVGHSISYEKRLIALGSFHESAQNFFDGGGKGLNITVPFKEDAFAFADQLSERAKAAGAVNTLVKQSDGSILGENTDGYGLVSDITKRLGWQIKGASVLILGAGGAVRGILLPLLGELPKSITIANRTESKAQSLADLFESEGNVQACGFDGIGSECFDIIINGTSASLTSEVPNISESCVGRCTEVYDMVYGAEPTAFMEWALDNGAQKVSDGIGMLVGQAAESFQIWRGISPSIDPVIQLLRTM